jgi:hypothetical protein
VSQNGSHEGCARNSRRTTEFPEHIATRAATCIGEDDIAAGKGLERGCGLKDEHGIGIALEVQRECSRQRE